MKQEFDDDLSVYLMNILPKVSSLPNLLAINFMKMEIQIVQTVTWPHVGHLIKGSCLGASNTMSAPCQLWCRYIFWWWRHVFCLSRDPTSPFCWDVIRIYGWELLVTCHHTEKFGGHKHSDSSEERCFIKNIL